MQIVEIGKVWFIGYFDRFRAAIICKCIERTKQFDFFFFRLRQIIRPVRETDGGIFMQCRC